MTITQTAFEQDDIDVLLSAGPHTFTAGAVIAAPCVFSLADVMSQQLVTPAQVIAHASVLVNTSTFPSLKGGDACSVLTNGADPQSFTVHQLLKVQDGAITEVLLRRA